jgi:ribosomal protein S18 acetylase RimI-like enzyme
MLLDVRHMEEAALNAWPALQTLVYDGWLLRFANGYTKRANSVVPLYAGTRPLEAKIAYCERVYRQHQQPMIFRLPSFVERVHELDAALAARGYQYLDETIVQLSDLRHASYTQSDRAHTLLNADHWLPIYHGMEKGRADRATHARILTAIMSPTCYIAVRDVQHVACGLGVCDRGYVGLFDMVTDAAHRRRGYGMEVVRSLLAWGQEHYDADFAYLQVMADNLPAISLYGKFGFEECYRYWYRVKA